MARFENLALNMNGRMARDKNESGVSRTISQISFQQTPTIFIFPLLVRSTCLLNGTMLAQTYPAGKTRDTKEKS